MTDESFADLAEDLLSPAAQSVAVDAMAPILRKRGAYYMFTAADQADLWEDGVCAVLEHLGIEVPE